MRRSRGLVARLRTGFDEAAGALAYRLDVEQQPAADRLARLGADVAHRRGWGRRPARGVYLHGPVGRGKTWLVDVLLEQLSGQGVLRLHAYESSRRLHQEVARQAGTPGAVDRAVERLLRDVRLLFLDELHAHDPGDAMLLTRLITGLHERGGVLVATSNYEPAGLLPHPLHHHLVQPLVTRLQATCDVVEVAGPLDHRAAGHGGARPGWTAGAWVSPGSHAQLQALDLPSPGPADGVRLQVAGRPLPARAVGPDLVWLTFAAACQGRTSVSDFLALAERHRTIVLSEVPPLAGVETDARRRFADLIDVCWNADTRLIVISTERPTRVLQSEFTDRDRTVSRLSLLPAA